MTHRRPYLPAGMRETALSSKCSLPQSSFLLALRDSGCRGRRSALCPGGSPPLFLFSPLALALRAKAAIGTLCKRKSC